MSDAYLAPFLNDPDVIPPINGQPARITVRPLPPPSLAPPGPASPVVVPKMPAQQPASKPIQLIPVDHQPDFSMKLIPVDHMPDFGEPPAGLDHQPALTDAQLQQLAAQKGQIAPAPYLTPGGVGESAVKGYQDYFDPFTTNERGRVADQPMTPNAAGKVEQVRKDYMNELIAGADLATLVPLPGGTVVKAIFAGVGARAANTAKLFRAVELEKVGQSPSVIRQLTDWFRGADNIWRFEIPDAGAQLNERAAHLYRAKLRQEAHEMMLPTNEMVDPNTGVIRSEHLDEFRQRKAHSDALLRRASRETVPAHVIYDHPELYENYPFLRDVPVEVKDLGGVRGQYRAPSGPNDVGSITLDSERGANRLVMGHEVQHAVQEQEGFARGGSYSTPEVAAEAQAQIGVRRSELLAEANEINATKMSWLKGEYGYTGPENLDDPKYVALAEKFWEAHPNETRRLMEISASTHQLNAAHGRALHDAYHRLAGEVEARNVTTRTAMPPNELARKEPISTEDVERHKQIVIGRSDVSGAIEPSLTPAVIFNGRVYKGDSHIDALSRLPERDLAAAQLDGSNRGWVDHRGHFLDREEAQKYAINNDLIADHAPSWARTSREAISEWLKPPRPKTSAISTAMDEGGVPQRVNEGLHEFPEHDIGGNHEPERHQGDQAAAPPARGAIEAAAGREPGGPGSVAGAQEAATRAAAGARPLEFLPKEPITIHAPGGDVIYVPGPLAKAHEVAEEYMRSTGRKYEPMQTYRPVDKKRATRIAEQYERMKHAPDDPAVKASYDAMIDETLAQFEAIKKTGLKIEFIKPGMTDPYEASPRMATMDVRDNNHLWVLPTDSGFGTAESAGAAEALKGNPLLRDVNIEIGGHKLLANDVFRIVHDYFGHIKDGVGFRAAGEENAWRSHSRMYSPLARKAMTSETRGQNSWLNYGPHGDKNRTAKSAETIYADQKTGIMPNWTYLDGAGDPFVAPKITDERGHATVNFGKDSPANKSVQTVADPHRMMYPGIYEDPRKIAQEAAERVAPEDIDMKRLWGVTRGDLNEMAKGRVGNREPDIYRGPGQPRGSLAAQNIQTPQNTQRIQDILSEAGKKPGLKHADAWYILDPVYQQMEKMFGSAEAKVRFERLNTLMGMASPGSEVMTEIQRGTAANMKVEQGKFDEFLKHAGTPREFRKGPKDLERIEAHPYHRTAQAEPMEKYLDTGKIQSKEVKVPAYVQASGTPETGFQTTAPVGDSHFARGVGLADTRKGPTDIASSISHPEFHTLQPWWRDEVAGDMGLESVPAQARLWTALGPRTGVNSALGQGKLELLTKQIMKAAKRLGVTPEQARDMILSGKAHAGALAAGAVGAGAAADAYTDKLEDFVQ